MTKKFITISAFVIMLLLSKVMAQPFTNAEVTPSIFSGVASISGTQLTSSASLNVFFSNKISTYLSEASDLSLSKAYAVLDNSDGRLFIGGTFNAKKSLKEFNWLVFTGGIKVNVKDGFANIFGGGNFNNDIGLSLKATIFGKGSIWFDINPVSQKNKVLEKREFLKNKKLNEFDKDLTIEKNSQKNFSGKDSEENIKKFIADYKEKITDKFVEEEADFISENKLYNIAHSMWVSLDAYIPFTKSTYDITTQLSSLSLTAQNYKPYEFNISYTNFWEKNKWSSKALKNILLWRGTTLLTFKGSVIANNSVNASLIDSYSYDKYLNQAVVIDTIFLTKLKSKTVYLGDFEKFLTARFSGRFVYMPFSFIGVSAAFEKNLGKLDDLSWKLGIPVSLKDNEGKSKINFELVWKEVQKEHTIGISIGLPIGKNIF